jgi:hypothetical protein
MKNESPRNNMYIELKDKEEQFQKTWSSDEEDFIVTLKQYMRRMPDNSDKPDLFMNPIPNPMSSVWYNRTHKVSESCCADFLKSMAQIVGINTLCFTNKSGRETLVTWMAAQGVPDEIGMLVTSRHNVDGNSRYNRSAT